MDSLCPAYFQLKKTQHSHHPLELYELQTPSTKKLVEQIESLTNTNTALESKKDTLVNKLQDLRTLLALMGRQSSEEIGQIHAENKRAACKLASLKSALKYVHRDGNHMQKCAMYWDAFL